jgi:hypothetical protein
MSQAPAQQSYLSEKQRHNVQKVLEVAMMVKEKFDGDEFQAVFQMALSVSVIAPMNMIPIFDASPEPSGQS